MNIHKLPFHVRALFEDISKEPKIFDLVDVCNNQKQITSALSQFQHDEMIYFIPLECAKSVTLTNIEPHGIYRAAFKDDGVLRADINSSWITQAVTKALNYCDPEVLDLDEYDDYFLQYLADFANTLEQYSSNYLDILDAKFIKWF